MAKAIVLRETGGPEALRLEDVEVGAPGPSMVRLRQTAVGVNYHDVYIRTGLYKGWMELPGIPGVEAAGVVDAVGPDVAGFAPGDRVAYLTPQYGAYADMRLIPAERLLHLPDAISDQTAAAGMVKGLTAWLLLHRVHSVQPGNRVLVHAAAGGVGRILCRWAAHLGAQVIGTVGSAEKAVLARQSGCEHTILYREEDFVARVAEITAGLGVDVVYDSVGRDTFAGSLECLGLLGHLVNFGQSSGPVEPFAVSRLGAKSNSITRPVVFHYVAQRAALETAAGAFFKALAQGILEIDIAGSFPLAEVAEAHRMLEARRSTGSLILLP